MNYRTKFALLFLGNLLLLIGFSFLPWYIAPFHPHGNLLTGPSAWNIMILPFVAQTVPKLGGFLWVLPFWLLVNDFRHGRVLPSDISTCLST